MLRLAVPTVMSVLALQAGRTSLPPDTTFPRGPISSQVSHEILRLDRVASTLAGRPVTVNCWSTQDWAALLRWYSTHHDTSMLDVNGVTLPREHRIELSPFGCETLAQLLAGTANAPLFDAFAIGLVAHESAHASGIRPENQAECKAIRTLPDAAVSIGLPKADGVRLQRIYRGTYYPYEPARYRTPLCPAGLPDTVAADELGGASDLRPLAALARSVEQSLTGWRRLGGALDIGALSPCAPIESRSQELARFGDNYVSARRVVYFTSTTLRTRADYTTAISRLRRWSTCDLDQRRADIRLHRSTNVVSARPLAPGLASLSPAVYGRRFILVSTARPEPSTEDVVFFTDPRRRLIVSVDFQDYGRGVALSIERRAMQAVVRAG